MIEQKVALVTGVSSGIGRAVAEGLSGQGYRVFGSVRSATTEVGQRVERVIFDVRDEVSVARAVNEVISRANRIDVLVNNAGGTLIGAIEEADTTQAQELFDTNFFGAVRVTRAVLPTMRTQRSGRIVFIGSIVGVLPTPFMGFYSASKHALEGYSESLDHEVRKLGIRSFVIEPGFMKTRIDKNSKLAATKIQDYADDFARAGEFSKRALERGDDPSVVAKKIIMALREKHPRLRYPVGRGARLLVSLRRFMPEALFDRNLRSTFHLDAK